MKKLKLAHQRRPFFNVHTQRRYPKKAIENIRKFGISKYKKLERAGAAYDVREGRGYGRQRAIHPAQGKNVFLKQGKDSRFTSGTHTAILNGKEYKKVTKKGHPNEGKWVYRGNQGYEHMTWEELKERVKNPKTGKQPYKHTKGYLAELEDIRNWVKNKGGASKVYLSDVVEKFGDVTDDEFARDPSAETRIEKALGKDKYKKLIKGGKRKKTHLQDKIKFNKLVREVNRGDRPLIDLTQSKTNVAPNHFKNTLGPVEKRMYEKLSPKFKAVLSRIIQPQQKYKGTDAISEISKTTTKTFRKMEKKYPVAIATRGDILKTGQSYNDKSYILSQLSRHVGEGGDQYAHISGDTHATAKFRNLKTGRLITLQNIDINDPEFKEAADVYNDWKKIKDKKIDNPLKKGEKITIAKALEAGGDYLVKDHLDPDGVRGNPLKNLVISTQKANMAGQIPNLTEAEIKAVGRGLNLPLEDNIKRYTNYGQKLLKQSTDPDFKLLSPTEVIIKKEGTFKGIPTELKTAPLKKVESGYNDFVLNTVKKMRQDADLNVDGFCDWMGYARGGLATGGCRKQLELALEENPEGTFQQLANKTKNNKFRTAARQILSKLPKGGKLGMILAGAGAVGLGAGALMADELDPETDTMVYSPVEGKFVDKEDGDPEDQMGVLNWIAENPVKSSLMSMPAMYGIGAGANKLGAAKTAAYLTGWKAVIPAMMIPEKLWQYREGESLAEMTTDPWNAIWALGIDSTKSLRKKGAYYAKLAGGKYWENFQRAQAANNVKGMQAIGKRAFELTGANVFGREFWGSKNKMAKLGQSIMSPAARGTDLAFNQRLKPAMKKMADVFGAQLSGKVAKKGIGALATRVALGLGAAAAIPFLGTAGIIASTLGVTLLGADYLREQIGDYSMGKKKIDRLRSMGKISEEDANNYMSLLWQENLLPFGMGNRMFGDDEMMIGGQILDPDDQRAVAKGMEDEIDSIKESDRGTRAKWRQQEFFNEGGRVGMKFGGGMDRRGFLKWLAGITAGAVGGVKGIWKPGAKKVVAEVAKETLTTTNPDMWVPRLIAKIKAEGKLLEMADKKYVNGDIYEVLINGKKVRLESNPVSGQHQIDWQAPDYDGEMTRSIQFNEGEIITEGKLAGKKTNPEVNFYEPDRSTPYRDDFSDFDWVNDSDQILDDMQRWIGLEDVNVKPTGPKTTSNWEHEYNQGGEVETGAIARRQSEVPPLSGPDPQAQGIAGLFSQPKQVRVG